jgi:hypothetical protein
MASNSQTILVPPTATTNSAAPPELRPLKPIAPMPGPWWPWLVAIAAAVLLAALWLLVRWRRRRASAAPAIVVPPHVRARNRLRQALDLIHDPDRFCTSVSHALRLYLEERFELHAPDRTTEEFLAELQTSQSLSPPQKDSLGAFLAKCDLVKFARAEPSEQELHDLWNAAMQLVEETTPSVNSPDPGLPSPPSLPSTTSNSPGPELPVAG